MLDETHGLCMLSMGCAREREKKQLSWEDSRGGSAAPLEPEKVSMTNRTVAYKNWSPRLVLKVTSITCATYDLHCSFPPDLIWLHRRG